MSWSFVMDVSQGLTEGGPMLKLLPLHKKNPLLFLPPLSFSVNYYNGLAILGLGLQE